ncbi:MAG: HlyC/CorC family transporter [Ignavibacteriaceae bacterium]|nr:HlyC/CorC family transporter [Ignavibacteriaceae bacterium]
MEFDLPIKIILVFGLLILSAFFSGSEVAFFSLKQKKIEDAFTDSKLILRYANNLINAPRRLLVVILIGNTITNVAASIVAVAIALEIAAQNSISINLILTIQIVLLTLIILLFSELVPKLFASKHPLLVMKITAIPLYLFSIVIYPIAESLTELIRFTTARITLDKSKTAITEKELADLAEISHERGTIEEEEQEIITSFVEFKSVLVSEVMTPRVDMTAVADNLTFDKLIETITKSGHSRIPVYKENLDTIIGIIYAKDLLSYLGDEDSVVNESPANLVRQVIFVPERKKINEMLHEFQEKKTHIAIVVDEYGGTAGLVTLEDIIEEVVGEIWDEYDEEEDAIQIISPNKFLVLGKVSVEDFNTKVGYEIIPNSEEYDTIGGLIFHQAGSIPKEGFSIEIENLKLSVKEVLKKRIKRVEIEKTSE